MADLVDRAKLHNLFVRTLHVCSDKNVAGILKADSILKAQPTVEVKEVVHARWVKLYEESDYFRKCSHCGFIKKTKTLALGFPKFCEYCGAEMEGVE